MTKTLEMLKDLQAYGHLVGDPEEAFKRIPRINRRILLCYFTKWQKYPEDKNLEYEFLERWQPVREFLENE
uniref:Uncharacterized protein n=1 Tax=viral metagenome TaxID=1070528 RepID=A0A6H1ZC37_9ZZZZ